MALGATHGLELPFVWGQIDNPLWRLFVGERPPEALAVAMQDAWIAFARAGDPNTPGAVVWPRYDTDRRPTLELGTSIRVVDDPSMDARDLWYRVSVPS